jgi:hypothetical protein
MTDQDLLRILDDLEGMLATVVEQPDAQAVLRCHEALQQALAAPERGPRWPEVQARAQAVKRVLDQRLALLEVARDEARQDLAKGAQAHRALSAYRRG